MSEYKPKYEVDDRVVIKPDELCGGIEAASCCNEPLVDCLDGTDRAVSIHSVTGHDTYEGHYPRGFNNLPASWILGPALDFHEECEVSDTGKDWYKRHFIGYTPGCDYVVNVITKPGVTDSYCRYKYVRRIQKPTINDIELPPEVADELNEIAERISGLLRRSIKTE